MNMKSDTIGTREERHEKNPVLILVMMIMLACSAVSGDLITIAVDMGTVIGGYGNQDQGGGGGHDQGESAVHDGRH